MSWIKRLFSRHRLYGELSEEIREHREEKIEELVAGGMSWKEATCTARREFGNVTLTEEDGRAVWRWAWLEDLFMDLRYGFRLVLKNRGLLWSQCQPWRSALGRTRRFSVSWR